jgi:hypothetical protein
MTLVKVTPRFGGEATDGLGLAGVDVYDKGVHDFRLSSKWQWKRTDFVAVELVGMLAGADEMAGVVWAGPNL